MEETKTRDMRIKEILPIAYMTAVLNKGQKPSTLDVGLAIRDILDFEDERNLAYRIAAAIKIPATIISAERVTPKPGIEYFRIAFKPKFGKQEEQTIKTPLLNDYRYGKITEKIWNRFEPNGESSWAGKDMYLYKHNDPPREGDKSTNGYRCVVYAEPMNYVVKEN